MTNWRKLTLACLMISASGLTITIIDHRWFAAFLNTLALSWNLAVMLRDPTGVKYER